MPTELQQCPQVEQLVDYLLGKLPSEVSSICEAHIADCDPCEETIRSLDASDTLSELAMNGLCKAQEAEAEGDESKIVNRLVSDIEGWSQSGKVGHVRAGDMWHGSDLHDRAAEVQHFFEESMNDEGIGVVGKYRIVELLGAGSSGVVYRAIDTQLGRDVAVKFLRPSLGVAARQRFLTEAKAAAVVNHPNVVQIYEVGLEDKLAFIAMQCLPGQTLEQVLADRGSLPNDETRRIGQQISDGLAAAHNRGIIHRDIKPANIWIGSQTANVTILDFGLARILDEDPQLTCTGLIAGTPGFMSPEQTRGREIDSRSDFFSLGCLLYQCLTGVLPFKSENVLATLQAVQMLTPTGPEDLDPGVDSDLSSLVMTLLEKSPINRPGNARDVCEAFELPCSDWNFTPAKKCQFALSTGFDSQAGARSKSVSWWPAIVSTIAIGLCLAGSYFLPQIIRVATNQGQIVIESNDPDVQIEVLKGGEQIEIVDLKTRQKLNIVAGEYQIRPIGNENEIRIDRQSVTISRGSETIVHVRRERKDAVAENFSNEHPSEIGANDLGKLAIDNSSKKTAGPYLLDSGDILGVFIENVLGEFGSAPPVQVPPAGSDLPPSIGFPVAVAEDGTISLPLIPDLTVRGKTLKEAKKAVEEAYRGGENPILTGNARIIVTMSRKRGYQPPAFGMLGSIAMAAAQFEAAKAEYGSDHPFVKQLRLKLESELFASDRSKPEKSDSQKGDGESQSQ